MGTPIISIILQNLMLRIWKRVTNNRKRLNGFKDGYVIIAIKNNFTGEYLML